MLRTESRGRSPSEAGASDARQDDGDEKWRARCKDLEAKLAKASAGSAQPPELEKLSKLGREKRQQREAAAANGVAAGGVSDASSASSSDSESDGDPVPENDADDYIEGVGNVGEARDAYRKYMGQGKHTSAFGKGSSSSKTRLVAALEDKKKADAVEDSLQSLRDEILSLRAKNATLNAKLDLYGEAEPRAHISTEFTATASAVRLLRPLHGEWVLVAGSDSHVDIVADEYEPSHKELHSSRHDSNAINYKAFIVV